MPVRETTHAKEIMNQLDLLIDGEWLLREVR